MKITHSFIVYGCFFLASRLTIVSLDVDKIMCMYVRTYIETCNNNYLSFPGTLLEKQSTYRNLHNRRKNDGLGEGEGIELSEGSRGALLN